MEAIFTAAINAASNPVMVGVYLGGLMFCLGMVPAVGMRIITIVISDD